MTIVKPSNNWKRCTERRARPRLLKELDRIIPEYAAFIEASPFVALATGGPEGLDCSPRGDLAGFVRIEDERTLAMPDRHGNNRVDSLQEHRARRQGRAAVPGAGLRHHAARQRPRRSFPSMTRCAPPSPSKARCRVR